MKVEYDMLNDQQKTAVEKLRNYLSKPPEGKAIKLWGYAGTGKSTILRLVLEGNNKRKFITAPTHKAVNVIRKMTEPVVATFSTLHSALALEAVIEQNGKRKFKQRLKVDDVPITTGNIIVVDETSMVEDELYDILMKSVTSYQHIILMGDSAQLPPVGHDDGRMSKPFRETGEAETAVELTQIMRQGEGSGILAFAKYFRERKEAPKKECEEIEYTVRGQVMRKVLEIFKSEEYQKDKDLMRILCFTNRMVDLYNQSIHKMLHPGAEEILVEGEQIMFQEPYIRQNKNKQKHSFQNAEEVVVQSVQIENELKPVYFYINPETGEGERIEYTGKVLSVIVQGDDLFLKEILIAANTEEWAKWLSKIKDTILELPFSERREAWKNYYSTKGTLAEWKHSYAMTVHKSQGSSYQTVVIDKQDLNICRKPTYWRMMYTAVTRARAKLIIVE